MLVESQNFGPIEISTSEIIKMVRPILGFEGLTDFCLIEKEESSPFLWLQSIDDSAVAFVIVNPCLVYPDYKIEINPKEISEIEPGELHKIDIYVIAKILSDFAKSTVNLQAPILINRANGKGKQLVLMNSELEVQYSVFDNKLVEVQTEEILIEEPIGA